MLIDVGGPILSEDGEYAAWEGFIQGCLRERGIEVSIEEVRDTVRGYLRALDPTPWLTALWHYLRPDVGAFREAAAEFGDFKRDWISKREFRVQEGAMEALGALREAGYILALAGNQDRRTGEFLRREGLTEGFSWTLVSEEMGVTKPLPLFFRMILDAIGVGPEEAVMVGDRLDNDVLPAKVLGMRTIRVLAGPYREQVPLLSAYRPDLVIEGISELPGAVASLG